MQILRAITQATVIAVDLGDDKLALAREVGAHHAVTSDEHAAERIRELTNGLGATAVFDFVGVQPTIDLARAVAGHGQLHPHRRHRRRDHARRLFSTPMGAAVPRARTGARAAS